MSENALNRTPLFARHGQQGAKLVPFAGWEMPLHFGSILEEHHATRTSGSIFDVSHMGRLSITG
ncbi:MAG: glycine cleavage system aminomethyltransferase GcvT, partial [Planctomycetota bacterium]|nr:glycine cleavage system aminomethyltransferase GcvT [Planctomycetota bacterium]